MAKLPKHLIKQLGFDDPPLRKKYGNQIVTDTIGGKTYTYQSKGERKLALYLQLLKDSGYIKDWEHESHKFVFSDTSWLIDFTVRNNDDSFEYYEFKGHVEPRTKKLIRLVSEHYPQAKITMVMKDGRGKHKLGVRARSRVYRVCTMKELRNKFL